MWWPPFCSNATADILDQCSFFLCGLILYRRNADSKSGGKKKRLSGRVAVFRFGTGLGFLGAGGHSRTLGILCSSDLGVSQVSLSAIASSSFSCSWVHEISTRKSPFCCSWVQEISVLERGRVVTMGFRKGKTMPSMSNELSAFFMLSLDRSTESELIPMTAIII